MRIPPWIVLSLLTAKLAAIPNSVLGPVALADSPLNGRDLTSDVLAAGLWSGDGELPGNWSDEGSVGNAIICHLLARPKLFGREVVLLRAEKRGGRLSALEATFADAGSFFGYFDEKLPANLDRRAKREEIERRVAARQVEFTRIYTETLADLEAAIGKLPGVSKPRETDVGHSRVLRAETRIYQTEGLSLSLLADGRRLIRLNIARGKELPKTWLDAGIANLSPRDRAQRLRQSVRTLADGTVAIDGLQPLPQGYRPYCGLNSLAMVARHFGLHIDEDWLAAAGGFKNTGSAEGSAILKLYPAVASEAGFSMDRANRFDAAGARRALANGFPVIVWRRFSQQRDRLHTTFAMRYTRNPDSTLPDPADPAERASWPGVDAPLHASVLTGYHDARREFLFLESWSGRDKPRRMRVEELAATSYLTFVFHP